MFHTKSKHTFCVQQLFTENRAVHEIMWENVVQPNRPQMEVRCMRIARWISKASSVHSEYLILMAFPQQRVYTKAPQCYFCTYIASLFINTLL